MRFKRANLPHVAVWRHLTGIGAKTYYIVICCLLMIVTFWAQPRTKARNPINILSREEQDFSHQDASGHKRLSWNLPPVSTTTKAFAVSRYPWKYVFDIMLNTLQIFSSLQLGITNNVKFFFVHVNITNEFLVIFHSYST